LAYQNLSRACFLAAIVLAVAASACGLWRSMIPPGASQFRAPPVYSRWWSETEACSGLTEDLQAIRWFSVPGVAALHVGEADALAYWNRRSNVIVVADSQSGNGSIVRHEMLHALLGINGHPRAQFLGRCYGWVNCGACADEHDAGIAGMQPVSLLSQDSLELEINVVPAAPSAALDDGFFSVIVTARNPHAGWRVIPLGLQNRHPPQTFGLDLAGPTGGIILGEVALDYADSTFAPLESKRFVYDFQLGTALPANRPPSGRYEVRGRYGTRWTEPHVFDLRK
jgi:hypothetical protein